MRLGHQAHLHHSCGASGKEFATVVDATFQTTRSTCRSVSVGRAHIRGIRRFGMRLVFHSQARPQVPVPVMRLSSLPRDALRHSGSQTATGRSIDLRPVLDQRSSGHQSLLPDAQISLLLSDAAYYHAIHLRHQRTMPRVAALLSTVIRTYVRQARVSCALATEWKPTDAFRRSTHMTSSDPSQSRSCRWELNPLECSHPELYGPTDAQRCATCPKYLGRMRGAGDVVHAIAKATGVAAVAERVAGGSCGGCAARRAALNAALPFSDTRGKE